MEKMTPQQRWQDYRTRLPQLTRRQKWGLVGASLGILMSLVVFVVPFALSLVGPDPQDPGSLADPNGLFWQMDDVTVYYVHWPAQTFETENKAPVVLLLHGQAGSSLTWRETGPALQKAGFDVYAVDLLGLGLSSKDYALDFSYPAQVEMLLRWMDALGIEQAHVVTHAFSANIAARLAQQHPERIQQLAFVAPTLFTEPSPTLPRWLFDLPFLKRWMRVSLHWVVAEAIGEQLRSATKRDEVVTDQLIADYGRVLRTADWDLAVWGMLRDSHKNALSQPLADISQPVLLLWGAEDGWATPDHAPGLLEQLPNSCLVTFDGVGHLPMHETPAEFSASLITFFRNSCDDFQP
jgi:pimeloyl-ACP methyl ester carboxylesterase